MASNGKWTLNKDAFPIENGDLLLLRYFTRGQSTINPSELMTAHLDLVRCHDLKKHQFHCLCWHFFGIHTLGITGLIL